MIMACHFDEGAVIVADSRVTWTFSDSGQLLSDRAKKILPLGSNVCFAFSGSVSLATKILSEIRVSIKKKPRLSNPIRLLHKLSRTATYFYSECLRNADENRCSISIILGCVPRQGRPFIWTLRAPSFEPVLISQWDVIGTGSVVRTYLEKNFQSICNKRNSLKDKATILISTLESELCQQNVVTVGGLFQAILLSQGKICPLTYRYMDLTPDKPSGAKETTISKGTWTQKDLAKKKEVSLVEPHILLKTYPEENRFQDYKPPQTKRKSSRWYLGHFITCLKVAKQVNETTFHGLISQVGSHNYPISIPMLTSLAFWGAYGTYPLKFCLINSKGQIVLYEENICINFPYEPVEFDRLLKFDIEEPGPVFFECYIDCFLLARRALYFGKLEIESHPPTKEWFATRQNFFNNLVSLHRECTDPALMKTVCFLDYFIICQEATLSENECKFMGEMKAVYSKKYPLSLQVDIVSVFRLSKGKHCARIDLFNAFTNEVITVTSGIFEGLSECISVPVRGRVVVKIPEPGMYYFNLYVDDQFISSILLPAENDNPKYSYTLGDEDLERIRSGEVFILAKRSKQLS
ncbi:MAG: hypothetical protein ACFFC7_32535 [Candidatus Hermodarchaeota archaeon]